MRDYAAELGRVIQAERKAAQSVVRAALALRRLQRRRDVLETKLGAEAVQAAVNVFKVQRVIRRLKGAK